MGMSGYLEPVEPRAAASAITGCCSRVVDGDTIDIESDGETYRIRFLGVDCPEGG